MSYNNRGGGGGGGFDLNKYETVKSRKVRLRNDHPESLIIPFPMSDLNYAANYILMGALIWKKKETINPESMKELANVAQEANPQNAGILLASLAALLGADGVGYSLSMAGGKGADRNAWVENAEESAVGRELDNMG